MFFGQVSVVYKGSGWIDWVFKGRSPQISSAHNESPTELQSKVHTRFLWALRVGLGKSSFTDDSILICAGYFIGPKGVIMVVESGVLAVITLPFLGFLVIANPVYESGPRYAEDMVGISVNFGTQGYTTYSWFHIEGFKKDVLFDLQNLAGDIGMAIWISLTQITVISVRIWVIIGLLCLIWRLLSWLESGMRLYREEVISSEDYRGQLRDLGGGSLGTMFRWDIVQVRLRKKVFLGILFEIESWKMRLSMVIWGETKVTQAFTDIGLMGDLWCWRFNYLPSRGLRFMIASILMEIIGKMSINRAHVDGFISHSHPSSFLHYFFLGFSLLQIKARAMSQANVLKSSGSNKGKEVLKPRLKITVPRFDNTELIKGYSLTLIGRCMNPQMQDMNTLLFMMPRIWKMEGRVAGADLGMGRFQFDFDSEDDIAEVIKMEPYHFDYWMLSLVRWQPVIEANYPSAIIFWVRVMGIPLHFWAEPTFRSIGEALGEVKAVDIDGGRVKVCVDGFKPLILDTTVEFHGGEETTVTLRYERLFGFCQECLSLCHDISVCPVLTKKREEEVSKRREEKSGSVTASYKGVVIHGAQERKGEDYKGKGKMVARRDDKWQKHGDGRGKSRHGGDGFSHLRMPTGYPHPRELRKRHGDTSHGLNQAVEESYEETFRALQPRLAEWDSKGERASRSPRHQSAKKVRKELNFDEAVMGLDEIGNKIEGVVITTTNPEEVVPEKAVQVEATNQTGEDEQTIETVGVAERVAPQTWNEVTEEKVAESPEGEKTDGVLDPKVNAMQIDEVAEELTDASVILDEAAVETKVDDAKVGLKGKQGTDRRPGVKKKLFRPTVGVAGGSLRRFVQAAKTPKKKTALKVLDENANGKDEKNEDPSEGSGPGTQITE